jgi:uncharacterized protein (DUF58 family)
MDGELHAAVEAAAAAAGLSTAAWLRQVAVEVIGAASDLAVPVRRHQRPLPSVDVVRLAEIREALGEATGALKKSAVFAREAGNVETHALLEALLPVYRQHADDLVVLKRRLQDAVG